MGAVANRAGELFAGIVAEVPFVDVLNTMLDDTLPLTPPEWPEWGNPIASEKDFRTILSYSPYDNVAAKDYPAILAMAGLTDPRVTYWEPAKWIARLRATMTGGGPVLLRTNMGAGHGGASGRFDRLDEVAIVYAFALWAVGMAEEQSTVVLVRAGTDIAHAMDGCRADARWGRHHRRLPRFHDRGGGAFARADRESSWSESVDEAPPARRADRLVSSAHGRGRTAS